MISMERHAWPYKEYILLQQLGLMMLHVRIPERRGSLGVALSQYPLGNHNRIPCDKMRLLRLIGGNVRYA